MRLDDFRNVQDVNAADEQEREYDFFSVSDIMSFFKHFWPLIATSAFICTVLGLLYILVATPTYTAVAQLLIETNQSAAPAIALPEAVVTLDTPQIESEIALLTSEQIVRRAAKALDQADSGSSASSSPANNKSSAAKDSHSSITGGGGLSQLLLGNSPPSEAPAADENKLREEMNEIQGDLSVKRVGVSYVLELSYNAKNPKIAADVVNALADAYVQDKIDGRAESARRSGLWLEARIEEIRRLMNEAALDVQEFKARRDYRLADRPTPNNRNLGLDFLPKPSDGSAPPAASDSKAAPKTEGNGAGAQDAPTLEELDSRALTYRKIYESYLQAYTDTVQRQSFPGTASRVIARAEPPKRQSSPKRLLTLLGSMVLGSVFGIGVGIVRTAFEGTVRSSHQLSRLVGTPLLGEVDNSLWLVRLPLIGKIFRRRGRKEPNALIVLRQPNSLAARQLVRTAAAIKAAALAKGAEAVGILAMSKGVDAAAVCSNIALLSARAGKKTLLIEAQPGRFNLSASLMPQHQYDLKDVVDDGVRPHEAIVPFGGERMLSVLCLSDVEKHGFWSLERIDTLRATIKNLSGSYDNIFVHLPASSEAEFASKAVDGVVVVAEMWRTKLSALQDVMSRMQIIGQASLGVVTVHFA